MSCADIKVYCLRVCFIIVYVDRWMEIYEGTMSDLESCSVTQLDVSRHACMHTREWD